MRLREPILGRHNDEESFNQRHYRADGSYIAEYLFRYLFSLGYEVHGLVRRVALEDPQRRFTRLGHLLEDITLHPASMERYPSIFHVVSQNDFDECSHLAAQGFVGESFQDGFSTMTF